ERKPLCVVSYAQLAILRTVSYGAYLWDRIAIRKITGEHNVAVRVWPTLKKIMVCRTDNMGVHCCIPCAYHYCPHN
ncbi:hypothetical protein, partial [Anaplasma phagocytophilum]|uniref:hypothetical protein n=1 Tax=Anaplasma phagocytophilum TaxID=948 RepID=UPI001E2C84FF